MTCIRGARVLVTGASSGIGRATALALAARGARLILAGRDRERLAEVADRTGGEVIVGDLADPDRRRTLADLLSHDRVDIVVHNAGVGLAVRAAAADPQAVQQLFVVNALAPIELTRAVLPGMLARGAGHLVFVTSIAGVLAVAGESAYAASKAALQVYADSARGEVGRHGIVVTTVVPGVVDTEFFTRRGAAYARRFPRPVPASRVAQRLADAVQRDRAMVVVPPWLRVPIALHGLVPGPYARLAARFG